MSQPLNIYKTIDFRQDQICSNIMPMLDFYPELSKTVFIDNSLSQPIYHFN